MYKVKCELDSLKNLPLPIQIKFYNLETRKTYKIAFNLYDTFCKFMDDNNFGIKVFKKTNDFVIEYDKIDKFMKTVAPEVIQKYTCIAMVKNKVFLNIIGTELLILANAHGTLKN